MATRKPGFLDTTTNRNKRLSRFVPGTNNDTAYRFTSTNNNNRNRFS